MYSFAWKLLSRIQLKKSNFLYTITGYTYFSQYIYYSLYIYILQSMHILQFLHVIVYTYISLHLYHPGTDQLCAAPPELVGKEWGSLTLDNFTCQGEIMPL
jgi:hypothetical protein